MNEDIGSNNGLFQWQRWCVDAVEAAWRSSVTVDEAGAGQGRMRANDIVVTYIHSYILYI